MNHTLKTVILVGALLCAIVFSFGDFSPGTPTAEAKTSPTVSGVACSTFCRSEGGTFYLNLGATTQLACTNQGGDWFPDSGCCCKCTRPGQCL
ncbi:MAG TPA: hypothetical protein VF469_25350 [Kofleriaceae bacterium]